MMWYSAFWPKLQLDMWLSKLDKLQAEQVGYALAQIAGQMNFWRWDVQQGQHHVCWALVWMQVMLCPQGHCAAGSAGLTA